MELHDDVTMDHIMNSCHYDITLIALLCSFNQSCLAVGCDFKR